jgi:hypothetical protein
MTQQTYFLYKYEVPQEYLILVLIKHPASNIDTGIAVFIYCVRFTTAKVQTLLIHDPPLESLLWTARDWMTQMRLAIRHVYQPSSC